MTEDLTSAEEPHGRQTPRGLPGQSTGEVPFSRGGSVRFWQAMAAAATGAGVLVALVQGYNAQTTANEALTLTRADQARDILLLEAVAPNSYAPGLDRSSSETVEVPLGPSPELLPGTRIEVYGPIVTVRNYGDRPVSNLKVAIKVDSNRPHRGPTPRERLYLVEIGPLDRCQQVSVYERAGFRERTEEGASVRRVNLGSVYFHDNLGQLWSRSPMTGLQPENSTPEPDSTDGYFVHDEPSAFDCR